MKTIRDLFNPARDHDETVEVLIGELDYVSQCAGYSLEEYAEALEAMYEAIGDRIRQVHDEL